MLVLDEKGFDVRFSSSRILVVKDRQVLVREKKLMACTVF